MYHSTESARVADLVLPAAGWGEKEGCFINSERRIGTTKAVRKAPGIALSDFRIFRLIAEAWGCGERFARWTTPEAAFLILRDLTKDRPCDITGIQGYDHLDAMGGIQWPYPETDATLPQERRLFEDGSYYHEDAKARILFDPLPNSRGTGRGVSFSPAHWPGNEQPVAHTQPHRQIRHFAKTLSHRTLRRNPPG